MDEYELQPILSGTPSSHLDILLTTRSCACFNLRKATRALTQMLDNELRPCGLLATQFAVLAAIALMGEPTMTSLATELGMDRTTLTRDLKPLQRHGWIDIQPGRDRRVRHVFLTDAGRKLLMDTLPVWQSFQTHVVKALGQNYWEVLLTGLNHLALLTSG